MIKYCYKSSLFLSVFTYKLNEKKFGFLNVIFHFTLQAIKPDHASVSLWFI